MSARDWMEIVWHAALLLLVLPPVLDYLRANRRVRYTLAAMILVALAYHVAVVTDCQAYFTHRSAGRICTWS